MAAERDGGSLSAATMMISCCQAGGVSGGWRGGRWAGRRERPGIRPIDKENAFGFPQAVLADSAARMRLTGRCWKTPPVVADSTGGTDMAYGICSLSGCMNEGRIVRGWCWSHYQRWYRHGDPLAGRSADGAPREWLMSALLQRDRGDCWLDWPFATRWDYPVIGRRRVGHIVLEHEGHVRPEPPRHQMLHACDRPLCFNPRCLRWGTQKENIADMYARNRAPSQNRGRERVWFSPGCVGGLGSQ